MRILLITENLGSGGAERQLTGLAVLLKQRGYTVKVVTYVEQQFYESFLRENNVDYELRSELWSKKLRIVRLAKLYWQFRPSVIISFLPSVNISVCISRLFYRCKLIVSERSHTMAWNIPVRMRYFLYHIADKIVANSFSEVENICEHVPSLVHKSFAIPNFVDTDKFVPKVGKKNNKVIEILCVGRLISVKNVLLLIEAAKIILLRNSLFRITWVGSQYDKVYLSLVKDKIVELEMQDHFRLLDQTNDVVSLYQEADIFCLPSSFEGYPNVICEAMSCGLPVICSNVCDNPYIVTDGENGYLFSLDVNDIADKLNKILTISDEERMRIGNRNRIKICENNSENKFIDNYISIL